MNKIKKQILEWKSKENSFKVMIYLEGIEKKKTKKISVLLEEILRE